MRPQTTPIPRYRPFDGPALFRQGFRPFFLGAGVWALSVVAFWPFFIEGGATIPTAFDPIAWHAHEMIFGFVMAAVAGFFLTAIPNWTGRMPLQGRPLAGLFGLWALGRVAVAVSGWIGAWPAAAIDLAFPAVLLAAILYEIVSGRNWRNLPMAAALGGLLGANLLMHLEAAGQGATEAVGERLGIAVVVFLIGLVGGRLIPSFTRNLLAKRGARRMPAPFGTFDRVCLGLTLAALAGWTAAPESAVTAAGLLSAALANLIRLVRWRGAHSLGEPFVWSLHLGFLWVPIGLALVGLGAFWAAIPPAAGLHALTAGAMGAMTLAVMARASLSYTGRPLAADPWTVALYLLAAAAAALRVLAPFAAGAYLPLMHASVAAWSVAFGLFSLRYGRILASR